MPYIECQQIIPLEYAGQRLDIVLARLFPEFSRARLQQWMKAGYIHLNGKLCTARSKIHGGEHVNIQVRVEETTHWQGQVLDMPPIVYEDEALLVINKPVGMVVHPAAGNATNTLANALLHYCSVLQQLPRAGIVHRLDKNTSGLLVVAKTLTAQHNLVMQLQQHTVQREYIAIINGVLISGGTINQPLGRDPQQRQRRAVVLNGKPAITHYRVIERFRAHTLVKVLLETGRTHQIRVHMASIGHPLLGDKVYGARPLLPRHAEESVVHEIRHWTHQALHARKLSFTHPMTGQNLHFSAPIPAVMEQTIITLRQDQLAQGKPYFED